MSSQQCWNCKSRNDASAPVGDEVKRPSKGDVSVCFYCGVASIFTGKGLEVREPTDLEKIKLLMSPDVLQAQELIHKYHAQFN